MRTRISPIVGLFLLFFPLWTSAQNLVQVIQDEMEFEHIPSVSACIVKDGEIVWMQSFGFADVQNNVAATPQTPYLLASVSKTFTATALMQAVEEGLIDLEADVNTYLPFSLRNPDYLNIPITVKQLMTHTSSIQDNWAVMEDYYTYGADPILSLSAVMNMYFDPLGADFSSDNFLGGAPGTVYEYTNMGNALLGYLVERVTNEPFETYCDAHIFERLCMENTSWKLSDFDTTILAIPYKWQGGEFVAYQHYTFADYPNGGLRASIEDLAHYLIAYQQNGIFGTDTLLSPNTVAGMLTPQVLSVDATQGLVWYLDEFYPDGSNPVSLWTHNGGESGVSTDIILYPSHNAAIGIITNGEGDNSYMVDALLAEAETLVSTGAGNPTCSVTSIDEWEDERASIQLYPNPVRTVIFLEEVAPHTSFAIHNLQGQIVSLGKVETNQIEVEFLPTGMYIFSIDGKHQRFIKQ